MHVCTAQCQCQCHADAVRRVLNLLTSAALQSVGVPALNKWLTVQAAMKHVAFLTHFCNILPDAEKLIHTDLSANEDPVEVDDGEGADNEYQRQRAKWAKRSGEWLQHPFAKASQLAFLLLLQPLMHLHAVLFKNVQPRPRSAVEAESGLLFRMASPASPVLRVLRDLAKLLSAASWTLVEHMVGSMDTWTAELWFLLRTTLLEALEAIASLWRRWTLNLCSHRLLPAFRKSR